MEKPNNTLSDPGIEPGTPCVAVALATTRPTTLLYFTPYNYLKNKFVLLLVVAMVWSDLVWYGLITKSSI